MNADKIRAVILAAGLGRRLKPLTNQHPKCLLPLNTMTIIEHQLHNLLEYGINDIIIVVGYRANSIIKHINHIADSLRRLKVTFIHNNMYSKTNTAYSLLLARDYVKNCDFIYLNSDVVFHEEILGRLLHSPFSSCIAVERKQVGEEEVKVLIDLNSMLVKSIGKHVNCNLAYGEFIGIAKFSKQISNLLMNELENVISQGLVDQFFEYALDKVINLCELYAVDITGLPCVEVDTLEDYEEAKRIFSLMRNNNSRS